MPDSPIDKPCLKILLRGDCIWCRLQSIHGFTGDEDSGTQQGTETKKLFFRKQPQNKQLGLRRGLWGHSFNLPYSLELVFDFLEKPIWNNFHSFILIPDTWYLISGIWYLISGYPDIWTSGYLDIWISGYLDIWIFGLWWSSPLRTSVWCIPGRGFFFPGMTCPWFVGPLLGDFCIFWNQKRRRISPEVGSTNFQPVMFDMDLFGGKKVPRHIKRRAALDFGSHVP